MTEIIKTISPTILDLFVFFAFTGIGSAWIIISRTGYHKIAYDHWSLTDKMYNDVKSCTTRRTDDQPDIRR
jgi:hypothetical protein